MPFLLNVDREERVKTLLDGILPAFFTSYSNDAIIVEFSVVRRNRKPIIKAIEAKTCNATPCYVWCTPMYLLITGRGDSLTTVFYVCVYVELSIWLILIDKDKYYLNCNKLGFNYLCAKYNIVTYLHHQVGYCLFTVGNRCYFSKYNTYLLGLCKPMHVDQWINSDIIQRGIHEVFHLWPVSHARVWEILCASLPLLLFYII